MTNRAIPKGVWAPEPSVRAIVLAAPRAGAHFLLHCLGNHPQIYAARDEPLSRNSMVRSVFGVDIGPEKAMLSVWRQRGYDVGILKIAYRWFNDAIIELLKKYEARVVHLKRDVVSSAVSWAIYEMARRGEIEHISHSTEPVTYVRVHVSPQEVVTACEQIEIGQESTTRVLEEHQFPVLDIDYRDMVGVGEAQCVKFGVAERLREFLGVDHAPLCCRLRKVNLPPDVAITNWEEVANALGGYHEYE